MRRFTSGNRISLLRNGTEYFPSLLAAIAAAREAELARTALTRMLDVA